MSSKSPQISPVRATTFPEAVRLVEKHEARLAELKRQEEVRRRQLLTSAFLITTLFFIALTLHGDTHAYSSYF
jgi:hypothetical protein